MFLVESIRKLQKTFRAIYEREHWIKWNLNGKKINAGIQKFNGYYKQAVDLKKSDYMGNNDLINIYVTWKEDKGSDFTLEHSWRLLKDQFK